MNFPVTSRGIQFDGLASMYFWKSPQKLIFDLRNVIDSTYTAPFNTIFIATFLTAETDKPADLILPISARRGAASAASVFMLPSVNASNTISFP
jgi:hypothetical protein